MKQSIRRFCSLFTTAIMVSSVSFAVNPNAYDNAYEEGISILEAAGMERNYIIDTFPKDDIITVGLGENTSVSTTFVEITPDDEVIEISEAECMNALEVMPLDSDTVTSGYLKQTITLTRSSGNNCMVSYVFSWLSPPPKDFDSDDTIAIKLNNLVPTYSSWSSYYKATEQVIYLGQIQESKEVSRTLPAPSSSASSVVPTVFRAYHDLHSINSSTYYTDRRGYLSFPAKIIDPGANVISVEGHYFHATTANYFGSGYVVSGTTITAKPKVEELKPNPYIALRL